MTEIIENHSAFYGCANSCKKFVSSTILMNHGIAYNTVIKRHLRPRCPPFESAVRAMPPFSGFPEDRTDTGLCEPLWSIRLNCQSMTKLEMMHVLQTQVCGCITAHPGLPHQENETGN